MAGENENQNGSASRAAIAKSKPDFSNETPAEVKGDDKVGAHEAASSPDEANPDDPGDAPAVENKPSVQQTSSQAQQAGGSSNPALAQDPQAEPAEASDAAPTAAEPQNEQPESSTDSSAAWEASSARKSSIRVSASGGGGGSATGVPSGLAGRISSLSAAAGESLREMIAKSSVVKAGSGAVKAEGSAGTVKAEGGAVVDSSEPPAQIDTDKSETVGSPEASVKDEPVIKQEPPDSPRAESADRAPVQDPNGPLQTRESGTFTPEVAAGSPEREPQEHPSSAPSPRSSTASGRGVKVVKDELSPSDRRSSSYLYNDWDRTLYEKTGRPPPGEAHWSRDKTAHSGGSPSRAGGTEACSHSGSAVRSAARSSSARRRRPRSRRRPATSPGGRRTFDMARCQRETQDQFGRRIVYRHCFIEPEFTLRGQRIPVHGARKGSIVAAEDTYASFALEMVTPPSEGQLSAEKAQRRIRVKKKRRRRKQRSPSGRNLLRERILIEEQRRRLEEQGEKLEEDRIRLQETRLHLEQLEEWWKTEGLLLLQRDEIREQEEKIINAVIEEECLRIEEERERLQTEWHLLIQRVERQEKEEKRIKEELSALDEKQEEVAQQEQTGLRRMHEMKAVFDIERRMMEVDRKKLVNEVLTCDAFREAMEDAELGCWETLSDDGRSRSRPSSAIGGARHQPDPSDPFANIQDSRLERLLADVIQPPVSPEPAQRSSDQSPPELRQRSSEMVSSAPSCYSSELICSESDQSSVALRDEDGSHPPSGDGEAPRARPMRPITARGRPARASRSTPSGDVLARPTARPPPCATRSEGGGPAAAAVFQPTPTFDESGAEGEVADIWRRRPTIMRRSDTPSIAAIAVDEDEEPGAVGVREGSSAGVRSPALAVPDGPEREGPLRVAPAGEMQHAKSEGYIDSNARQAAVESERRRASAAPCLETQERTQPSETLGKTSTTDAVPEPGGPQPTVSSDTERTQSEATADTPTAAPSQTPQVTARGAGSSGEPGAEASAGGGSSVSAVASQPSSLRSGLRGGDASQRHVSFHDGTTVQALSDGAGSGAEDGDQSAGEGEGESGEEGGVGGTTDDDEQSETSADG